MTLDAFLDALTLEAFLDGLMMRPRGRIICCNALNSLNDGQCDKAFVGEVFGWWREMFCHRLRAAGTFPIDSDRFDAAAADALDALVLDSLEPGFLGARPPPQFRLRCRRRPKLKSVGADFATVTPVHGLLYHLIPVDERRRMVAGGGVLVAPDPTDPEVDSFALGGEQRVTLRGDPVGPAPRTVGRPHGLVWLTLTGEVAADLSHPGAAEHVRDILGLIHHGEKRALAVLHLAHAVAGMATGRPTFADAGAHRRFKAKADDKRARHRKAWGHTAHLALLAAGSRKIDGRLERVCLPIPTAGLGPVRLTPLGYTKSTRGTMSGKDDDIAFAERLVKAHGGERVIRASLGKVLGF